jgi:hypothetical protein
MDGMLFPFRKKIPLSNQPDKMQVKMVLKDVSKIVRRMTLPVFC